MSATEAVIDDLQALIGVARASIAVLGKGTATTGDVRTDVVAMRSILNRIDTRLDNAGGYASLGGNGGMTAPEIRHAWTQETTPGWAHTLTDLEERFPLSEEGGQQ